MQEKESIIVVWCELKILSIRPLKVLIIMYAKNMYFLFGTIKLEMSQMLF